MANEKRLVDANALMDATWDIEVIDYAKTSVDFIVEFDRFLYSIRGLIATAPTVDAVEVVLCKDCKHLGFKGLCDGVCNKKMIGIVKPDDFCSYGERREGE